LITSTQNTFGFCKEVKPVLTMPNAAENLVKKQRGLFAKQKVLVIIRQFAKHNLLIISNIIIIYKFAQYILLI
jgi:hypothetical protein